VGAPPAHLQDAARVKFDWGPYAAATLRSDVTVVVDVLRFSTAVEAAVSRGITVYPYRWKDPSVSHFAASVGGVVGRSDRPGPSLSPISLLAHNPSVPLVLPSPNGATCTLAAAAGGAAAEAGPTVVAGCLRNAAAVGKWVDDHHCTVTVVACGERWPDGSLRPCLEDLIGARAILSHLGGGGDRSPESRIPAAAYEAAIADLTGTLANSASGRDLVEHGLATDVHYAAALSQSSVVPILRDNAFMAAD
jgi:2-phosphosulfolactate phosphatase